MPQEREQKSASLRKKLERILVIEVKIRTNDSFKTWKEKDKENSKNVRT